MKYRKMSQYEGYNYVLAVRLRMLWDRTRCRESEIAEACGTDISSVSKWMNGVLFPDARNVKLLADFFDVSMDFLMGRTDVEETAGREKKK